MTDPRDGQPHEQFPNPDGPPPPPTTPPHEHGQFYPPPAGPEGPTPPTAAPHAGPFAPPDGDTEYVVHSGPHPVPPTSFQDAPDPFGGTGAAPTVPPAEDKKQGGKRWIIPAAAVVVLAVVAAAVYFLFFQSDDSNSTADDPPASEQTDPGRDEESGASGSESGSNESGSSESGSSESGSSESGSSESGSAGTEQAIAGTFQVNGTIESYSGPPTGQLGGTPKVAGAPAFTAPQTWTIDGCTDTTCDLTVEQGGMTMTLELTDGTWVGETDQQIACTPTAGAMTDATIKIEIPEAGGTAKRTLSAQCDEPIQEVDALTMTPQ